MDTSKKRDVIGIIDLDRQERNKRLRHEESVNACGHSTMDGDSENTKGNAVDLKSFPVKKEEEDNSDGDNEIIQKPKRALSAYNFFLREERQRIISMHKQSSSVRGTAKFSDQKNGDKMSYASSAGISFQEMGKLVGKGWKRVKADPELYAKYKKLADEDNRRYEEDLEEYNKKKRKSILKSMACTSAHKTKARSKARIFDVHEQQAEDTSDAVSRLDEKEASASTPSGFNSKAEARSGPISLQNLVTGPPGAFLADSGRLSTVDPSLLNLSTAVYTPTFLDVGVRMPLCGLDDPLLSSRRGLGTSSGIVDFHPGRLYDGSGDSILAANTGLSHLRFSLTGMGQDNMVHPPRPPSLLGSACVNLQTNRSLAHEADLLRRNQMAHEVACARSGEHPYRQELMRSLSATADGNLSSIQSRSGGSEDTLASPTGAMGLYDILGRKLDKFGTRSM